MQTITRATNNTLIFTLTERITLTSPYFLMKLTSRVSRAIKRVILAADLSSQTDRYNKFTLTESTTEVLTSGTVTLNQAGEWDYEIYEQSSSTNLDEKLSTVTTAIETGMLRVMGVDTNYKIYNEQGKEYKSYKKS